MEARRRSSASREGEDEKKAEKSAILRNADAGLRLSHLPFTLRRLGAAGGRITLRYYCRITNARLLRLAGVATEVRKVGGRDVWYVNAATDMLAAGREELRKAIAELVRRAVENGWVDEKRAKQWLEELEGGLKLTDG